MKKRGRKKKKVVERKPVIASMDCPFCNGYRTCDIKESNNPSKSLYLTCNQVGCKVKVFGGLGGLASYIHRNFHLLVFKDGEPEVLRIKLEEVRQRWQAY